MTVASARGRYISESVQVSIKDNLGENDMRYCEFQYHTMTKQLQACCSFGLTDLESFKNVTAPLSAGDYSQYIPNMPKKPVSPRATSRDRTSRAPRGKCSVLVSHIYMDEHRTVMLILANKTWKGW